MTGFFGETDIVRHHYRRQWFEKLGDDIQAALGAQLLDTLDDEVTHFWLDCVDLSWGETVRHQFAEPGVYSLIFHHHRRVILQPN